MKLYRVISYDYGRSPCSGGATIVGEGLTVRAVTSQAAARCLFRATVATLNDRGVRFTARMDLIETPARMTAEDWIELIEGGAPIIKVLEALAETKSEAPPC